LILAWIRLSNSALLKPEASYYLAHLVSRCGDSIESKILLDEVANSNDTDYAGRSKECSRGNCSVGIFDYKLVAPLFVNDSVISLSGAFPRFTADLPYDLSEELDHNWNGSAFLKSLNLHAVDQEFGSTIRFFISSMDFSDSVVRGIVNRHVGSCLESNQWPLGLYLLARFGALDFTDTLALEASTTVLSNVDAETSLVAAKVVGLTQAARLELLIRRQELVKAAEFIDQTIAFESGEWFFARALLSLANGNLVSAQKNLGLASGFGFAPAKLLSFSVQLENGDDLEDAKKSALDLGYEFKQSFPSPTEALLAIASETKAHVTCRDQAQQGVNSPRFLVAEEVLVLALVAAAVEDRLTLKKIITENFSAIPDLSIENFTEGLISFLNSVDSDLASADLSRWSSLLQVLEEDGSSRILQILANNPSLVNHDFSADSAPLVELFRGNSGPEKLHGLANHEDELVQLHVAKSPNVNAETLLVLSRSRYQSVQEVVISSKRLGKDQLHEVLSVLSSEVQWALASDNSTDGLILEALAQAPSESVRRAVAGNINTPEHVFDALALDGSWPVRQQVVANPSASDSAKALAALQS